jgi:signal transduction histidine kinase
MPGDSIDEIFSIQDRESFDLNFNKALVGTRTLVDKPLPVNSVDYWFELQYAPVRNEEFQIIGVLFTARDITESKKANETLKKYMIELEQLNQTKDKFFSIIAHDLRNPFAGIIGLSELLELKLSEDNHEQARLELKYTQMILEGSKSAFSLLENLLVWARSQKGEITISPRNIHFHSIASNTISVIRTNAHKKNIFIELNVSQDDIIYADESLVSTILRNLLTNAIKFTDKNGKITLSSHAKERYLEISVTDTGTGIEPKNLEKIFRIDSKFSKPGTESEKGTGLGLILCKEFVDKQGGSIWVESKPGIGSKFTFTLPLKVDSIDNVKLLN